MVVCIKWMFFPRRNIAIRRILTTTKTWLHVIYIFQKNHSKWENLTNVYQAVIGLQHKKKTIVFDKLSGSSCLVKSWICPRFHLKHQSAPSGSLYSCWVVLIRPFEDDLKEDEKTNNNYPHACKDRSSCIWVRAALFRFRAAALLCRGQVLNWLHGVPFLECDTVWRVHLDTGPFKVLLVVDAETAWPLISSPYHIHLLYLVVAPFILNLVIVAIVEVKDGAKVVQAVQDILLLFQCLGVCTFPYQGQSNKDDRIKDHVDKTRGYKGPFQLECIQRFQLISTHMSIFQHPMKESYAVIFLEFLMLQSTLAFQQF